MSLNPTTLDHWGQTQEGDGQMKGLCYGVSTELCSNQSAVYICVYGVWNHSVFTCLYLLHNLLYLPLSPHSHLWWASGHFAGFFFWEFVQAYLRVSETCIYFLVIIFSQWKSSFCVKKWEMCGFMFFRHSNWTLLRPKTLKARRSKEAHVLLLDTHLTHY